MLKRGIEYGTGSAPRPEDLIGSESPEELAKQRLDADRRRAEAHLPKGSHLGSHLIGEPDYSVKKLSSTIGEFVVVERTFTRGDILELNITAIEKGRAAKSNPPSL